MNREMEEEEEDNMIQERQRGLKEKLGQEKEDTKGIRSKRKARKGKE